MSNSGSSSPESSPSIATRTSTSHSSGREYISHGPFHLASADDAMSNPSAISLSQYDVSTDPYDVSTDLYDVSTDPYDVSTDLYDVSTDVDSLNSSASTLHQEEYSNPPNLSANESNLSANESNLSANESNLSANESTEKERSINVQMPARTSVLVKATQELPETLNNHGEVSNNRKRNFLNALQIQEKATTRDSSVIEGSQNILCQTPDEGIPLHENEANRLSRTSASVIQMTGIEEIPEKSNNRGAVSNKREPYRLDTKSENAINTDLLDEIPETSKNHDAFSNNSSCNPQNVLRRQKPTISCCNSMMKCSQSILSQTPNRCITPDENEPNSRLDSDPRHNKKMPVYSKPATANPWKVSNKGSVYRSNSVVRTGDENNVSNFGRCNPKNVQQTQETSTTCDNSGMAGSQTILNLTLNACKTPYENEPNSLVDSDPPYKKNMPVYSKPVTSNPWRVTNTSSVYRNNPVVRTVDENDVSNARRCNPPNDVQQTQVTSTIDGNSAMGRSQDMLDLTLNKYIPPNEKASK